MHRHVCLFVAVGTAAVLAGGCSNSEKSTDSTKPATSAPTSGSAASSKQQYLDTVNDLCDKLLPKVIAATHGGSTDISARQYLKDWPGHRQVLADFDKSLAAVPVPAAAASAAAAMRNYVNYADGIDADRLKAAQFGERAWRREVTAETNTGSDPSIAARTAAGFANSCDAR